MNRFNACPSNESLDRFPVFMICLMDIALHLGKRNHLDPFGYPVGAAPVIAKYIVNLHDRHHIPLFLNGTLLNFIKSRVAGDRSKSYGLCS